MDYKRIYDKIIHYRKNNVYNGYTEKHHIIPRCLGGSNDKDNIVRLSAKEHYICHLLLTKIYKYDKISYYKMVHAFCMMSVSSDNQIRYNAKKYEKLKIDYSNYMSLLSSKEYNNNFNKMWIFNPDIRICKLVNKDYILEDGWFKGRVCDWDKYFFNKIPKITKPKKIKNKSLHLVKQEELINIDWEFTYSLYLMYGFDIVCILTGYTKSRESLLMQFKKRVKIYKPCQKTKKISNDKWYII